MSEQIAVAQLRQDQLVSGTYACVSKERSLTRSGSPYLKVSLRDQTGAVTARAFRNADLLNDQFAQGDLVEVLGKVTRFRDELVLELDQIQKSEQEDAPEEFLPQAYRDLDELDGFLEHLAREVHDREYRALLDAVLGDAKLRQQFRTAPCSRGGHHAYLGGLLEHSVAVATLGQELAQLHPRLNSDLLLCAALLHDIGKTREFTYGTTIELSEEGKLVGHIELGLQLLAPYAQQALTDQKWHALAHCILMHHGGDQTGRRFALPEAIALHRLNVLDGSVKGAFERSINFVQ